MFGNAYQNGPVLDVWDAKVNVDKNQFYKHLFKIIPNYNSKYFDKEVKSYLYLIQGQNAKINLPADDNKFLSLHQRFLVLHIFIPVGFTWAIQLTMSDVNGIKRRINITTTQGKQQIKYFSFRYPVENLKKGVWLFLAIDIYSFMQVFKDQTFRSLDQISVNSYCRLRRIFTMKEFVQYQIPKNFWLSQNIPQQFQLISLQNSKLAMLPSKQLIQSISSPKKIQNNSNSLKKDVSPKINKSQLDDSRKNIQNKKNNLTKSEMIIQNARSRIQNLSKKEQILLQRSKELEQSPSFKLPKEKAIYKFQQQKRKSLQNRSKQQDKIDRKGIQKKITIPKQQKNNLKSSKLPQIQRSFKQDTALNIEYDESSNFTEQNMKSFTPKTPKNNESRESRQVIEQDHWSEQQREPSRPISEAISNMTGNFPSTVITKQNNKEIVVSKVGKKELELIYDQMVGCYYHPETNSYYELKR